MSQKNDFFAPIKLLWGLIDSGIGILGLVLIGLLIWDAIKSQSNLPESTWYTLRRTPPAYPQEIHHDVRIQQATYLDDLQAEIDRLRAELEDSKAQAYAEIREELENSKTGCISFANIPNAICLGPRQTVQAF